MAAKILLVAVMGLVAFTPASSTVLNASKDIANNANKINSAVADPFDGVKQIKFLGDRTSAKAGLLAKQILSIKADAVDDNPNMTSKEMEAAITNLMLGKTSFGATPMGGAIKKIKGIITKRMMPKVTG